MDSEKPDFSILDHTSDLGITVRGPNLKKLFEWAAKSMTQIMVSSEPSLEPKVVEISIPGTDLADLMVRWLGEILYLFAGEKEVVTDIEIDSIIPSHLHATLTTVPFDPNLHEILYEIKAVTYHQIEVTEKANNWEARIIFDL